MNNIQIATRIEELKNFLEEETTQCHEIMKVKGSTDYVLGRLAQIAIIQEWIQNR